MATRKSNPAKGKTSNKSTTKGKIPVSQEMTKVPPQNPISQKGFMIIDVKEFINLDSQAKGKANWGCTNSEGADACNNRNFFCDNASIAISSEIIDANNSKA